MWLGVSSEPGGCSAPDPMEPGVPVKNRFADLSPSGKPLEALQLEVN